MYRQCTYIVYIFPHFRLGLYEELHEGASGGLGAVYPSVLWTQYLFCHCVSLCPFSLGLCIGCPPSDYPCGIVIFSNVSVFALVLWHYRVERCSRIPGSDI
jgi:hypothetical protein